MNTTDENLIKEKSASQEPVTKPGPNKTYGPDTGHGQNTIQTSCGAAGVYPDTSEKEAAPEIGEKWFKVTVPAKLHIFRINTDFLRVFSLLAGSSGM